VTESGGNWTTGTASPPVLTAGNYYTVKIVSTTTTLTLTLLNATVSNDVVTNGSIVRSYVAADWSAITGSVTLSFGDMWGGSYYGTTYITQYREY
jgi:hypothetical protein